ncbi:MAG: hypothetical protein Kow00127_11460 [Bacteroidales bacterium]
MRTILFLVVLLMTPPCLTAQEKGDSPAFDKRIRIADSCFFKQDYINAKLNYQYALRLNPESEYAREKLDETLAHLKKMMAVMDEYTEVISEADRLFREGKFDESRQKYREAARLVPGESYPSEKIREIDEAERAAKERQADYDRMMKRSLKMEKYHRYDEALRACEQALKIIPGDSWAVARKDSLTEIKSAWETAQANYSEYIANGDRLFALQKFEGAREEYQKALEARPDEPYPAARLKEVEKALSFKAEFDQLVETADNLYLEKKLNDALKKYRMALELYPAEQYPADMISRINAALAESGEADKLVKEAVERGDNYMKQANYALALTAYKEAAELSPGNTEIEKKIGEAEAGLAQQQKNELLFAELVRKGDTYFTEERYNKALGVYRKADSLRPGQQYVVSRIDETADLAGKAADLEREKKENNYRDLIVEADNLFGLQKYEEAKKIYLKAKYANPDDTYPSERIEEINNLLVAQASKEQEYNRLVSAADRMLEDGNLELAQTRYSEALDVMPDAEYPVAQLRKIAGMVSENQREAQRKYDDLIAKADKEYEAGNYSAAKRFYKEALVWKPDMGYPAEKIRMIEDKQSELQELEKQYTTLITLADRHFTAKEYEDAKEKYRQALELFPDEDHPKMRLEEINALYRGQNESVASEYDQAIADADKFMAGGEYAEALILYKKAQTLNPSESYPGEMIATIDEILSDKAMRMLCPQPDTIAANTSRKYTFEPLEAGERSESELLMQIVNTEGRGFKVMLSFGSGNSKNGGGLLPLKPTSGPQEFRIDLGKQHTWVSGSNDYISLSPQGGKIIVEELKIRKKE